MCGRTFENKGFEKDFYIICGECIDMIEEMRENDPEFDKMMKMPIGSVDSQYISSK